MFAALLLILTVLTSQSIADRDRPASGDDLGVYQAIIANKIQPEVDRFSAGAGSPTPAPILTFDRTLMMCRPVADHPKPMGCLHEENFESFEGKSPRMKGFLFDGALSPASREVLARTFRERNRESQPFPGAQLESVIVTSPEGLTEAMARESRRTKGVSSFSLPAYSADGHALVYGSYTCGNVCGYGWLFLLQRRGEGWQVISVNMLWVS